MDSSEVKYELLILEPKTIIHNMCTVNVFSDQPSKHSHTRTQPVFHHQPQYGNSRETFIAYEASLRREFKLRSSPAVKLTIFRMEVSKCYFQLLRRPKNLEPIFLSIRRRTFLGIPAISLRVRSSQRMRIVHMNTTFQ